MEVGGYVMLAIVAVLALGCINSSIKAHKNKQSAKSEAPAPNFFCFPSPHSFLFRADAGAFPLDAASILERRTAVPRCALFVLSEISATRRIRRLFALPQHLPQSRHRAAELFLAAGVSRHQPKKYSKRS